MITYFSPDELDALPAGTQVVDIYRDIALKRPDGLWEGREMAPITSAKLCKYGPLRPAGTGQ